MIRITAFCLAGVLAMGSAACEQHGVLAASETQPQSLRRETIVIETRSGPQSFDVEIADDEQSRERGLMHRTDLGAREGMIFDYGRDRRASMWMKNTPLSLDMLFIRADGGVESIASGTTPHSEAIISSRGDVRAVLELNAGAADAAGIEPGNRVRASIFGNTAP